MLEASLSNTSPGNQRERGELRNATTNQTLPSCVKFDDMFETWSTLQISQHPYTILCTHHSNKERTPVAAHRLKFCVSESNSVFKNGASLLSEEVTRCGCAYFTIQPTLSSSDLLNVPRLAAWCLLDTVEYYGAEANSLKSQNVLQILTFEVCELKLIGCDLTFLVNGGNS